MVANDCDIIKQLNNVKQLSLLTPRDSSGPRWCCVEGRATAEPIRKALQVFLAVTFFAKSTMWYSQLQLSHSRLKSSEATSFQVKNTFGTELGNSLQDPNNKGQGQGLSSFWKWGGPIFTKENRKKHYIDW